jgi:hypothetical protein
MKQQFYIGDAVVPKWEPEHDVMTIYDFTPGGYDIAHCNWLVGIRMFKEVWPVSKLIKVERRQDKEDV